MAEAPPQPDRLRRPHPGEADGREQAGVARAVGPQGGDLIDDGAHVGRARHGRDVHSQGSGRRAPLDPLQRVRGDQLPANGGAQHCAEEIAASAQDLG
jgi:hypothetical protein